MRCIRPGTVIALVLALTIAFAGPSRAPAQEAKALVRHALAITGEPKYHEGFDHFDYVNPDAPKGGRVTMGTTGTYDSFNPFIVKGAPAAGVGMLYDTLTVHSLDEPFTQYGLIADKMELPEDRSWVIYHINPKARFHDGRPITAEDLVFTFNLLMEKGDPLYKRYYGDIRKVEALDEHRVRFDLGEKPNPELALIIGQIAVLPKHYWEGRDFSVADLEVPVGSGAYQIAQFDAGRSVTYKRVEDYWAADLPVNKGHNNFDEIKYEYYRDATVALQAFKSGEYDFRNENIAKNWATQYDGPPFKDKMIVTAQIPNDVDQGMQCFAFNTRRPIFEDRRVREAIGYAFDFEWTNRNLFYGLYKRSTSFFSNSELAAQGLPTPEELRILEPYRDQLPPEVFDKPYQPPQTDGSGNNRRNLRTAMNLLKQAGWSVKDGKLTQGETGRVLEFEILLLSPSFERVVLPFKKNLERLGITMNVRVVDTAQYINRLRDFDFDMIVYSFAQSESPGNEQRYFWSSEAADAPGTPNYCGIKSPAIDALVEQVISAPDRQALVNHCRALDRALLWGHYVIPNWHSGVYRVAYWSMLERPAVSPKYSLGFNTWWISADKARQVDQYRSGSQGGADQ